MHLPDKYGIINSNDLDNIVFSEVFENDVNSLRYNVDTTLFVIKWNIHEIPAFITNGTVIPAQVIDYIDALNLMASADWYDPDPPGE